MRLAPALRRDVSDIGDDHRAEPLSLPFEDMAIDSVTVSGWLKPSRAARACHRLHRRCMTTQLQVAPLKTSTAIFRSAAWTAASQVATMGLGAGMGIILVLRFG